MQHPQALVDRCSKHPMQHHSGAAEAYAKGTILCSGACSKVLPASALLRVSFALLHDSAHGCESAMPLFREDVSPNGNKCSLCLHFDSEMSCTGYEFYSTHAMLYVKTRAISTLECTHAPLLEPGGLESDGDWLESLHH